MNLEKAAREIAKEADECYNSGEIETLALQKLKDAYNSAISDACKVAKEWSGRHWVERIRKLKK